MGRGGRRHRRRPRDEDSDQSASIRSDPGVATHPVSVGSWWDSTAQRTGPLVPPPWEETEESEDKQNDTHTLRSAFQRLADGQGWGSPTPVQEHLWPWLEGKASPRSIAFVSATASGKTLAFGLPMLLRAMELEPVEGNTRKATRQHGLVLVPTRELAVQVGHNLTRWRQVMLPSQPHSRTPASHPLILVLHGGAESAVQQVRALHQGERQQRAMILVATPARCCDVLQLHARSRSTAAAATTTTTTPLRFTTICLDEADRLAMQTDLAQQVDEILTLVRQMPTQASPPPSQLLLCSATLPAAARAKWDAWIRQWPHQEDAVLLQMGAPSLPENNRTMENITLSDQSNTQEQGRVQSLLSRIPEHLTQVLHVCAEHKKPRKLIHTLTTVRQDRTKRTGLTIIFFNRIKSLQFAKQLLQRNQMPCLELHSQLSQTERDRVVHVFKSGRVNLLLATDLAARGLHMDHVQTVINYDFPGNLEQYIHRCGRAGRTVRAPQDGGGNVARAEESVNSSQTASGAVYSFFTRNLAAMAKDLVDLLRATNQQVDPNLLALVDVGNDSLGSDAADHQANHRARKRCKTEEGGRVLQEHASSDQNDDSDADGGAAAVDHPGSRIVLKRAGHVSDASSDTDDDS